MTSTQRVLPMFPLGTVLFPGTLLPVHVFEPRYRRMTADCIEGEGRMGVVLIERGSEVGGGDTRFSVGSEARILASSALPDGRWLIVLQGERRIAVARWLPDDPYPRAEVVPLAERPPGPGAGGWRDRIQRLVDRAHELMVQLGELPEDRDRVELPRDPSEACWQASALAPLGPADCQRVLTADDPDERLRLVAALLEERVDLLALRAGGG